MKTPYQFGVIRLLVLITLIGLLLAWMVQIRWNWLVAGYVGTYLFLIILWGTIRGPWIWSELRRLRQARQEVRLAAMLDLAQRQRQISESDGEEHSP